MQTSYREVPQFYRHRRNCEPPTHVSFYTHIISFRYRISLTWTCESSPSLSPLWLSPSPPSLACPYPLRTSNAAGVVALPREKHAPNDARTAIYGVSCFWMYHRHLWLILIVLVIQEELINLNSVCLLADFCLEKLCFVGWFEINICEANL